MTAQRSGLGVQVIAGLAQAGELGGRPVDAGTDARLLAIKGFAPTSEKLPLPLQDNRQQRIGIGTQLGWKLNLRQIIPLALPAGLSGQGLTVLGLQGLDSGRQLGLIQAKQHLPLLDLLSLSDQNPTDGSPAQGLDGLALAGHDNRARHTDALIQRCQGRPAEETAGPEHHQCPAQPDEIRGPALRTRGERRVMWRDAL